MNESTSCGLDSDVGFMNCCGMRTLPQECLVVLWHAAHDGYLGNAPPGRPQVYGFLDQQCQQRWPKTSVRERRFSRHENLTDPDVSFGWFERKGFTSHVLPHWDVDHQINSVNLSGGQSPTVVSHV